MKPQANNAFSGFQALFTLIRFALQLVHHALPAPYNAVLANYVVANSGVWPFHLYHEGITIENTPVIGPAMSTADDFSRLSLLALNRHFSQDHAITYIWQSRQDYRIQSPFWIVERHIIGFIFWAVTLHGESGKLLHHFLKKAVSGPHIIFIGRPYAVADFDIVLCVCIVFKWWHRMWFVLQI